MMYKTEAIQRKLMAFSTRTYTIVIMLNLVQSDDKLSYEHTIEHNRSN